MLGQGEGLKIHKSASQFVNRHVCFKPSLKSRFLDIRESYLGKNYETIVALAKQFSDCLDF